MGITAEYSDLLGKRFEYYGRGPDVFDCWGLVREYCKRAGVLLPDHSSTDDPAEQAVGIKKDADTYYIKVDEPEIYDIVLFQVIPRFVTHCGVYVGSGRFLQVTAKSNVAVEELESPIWKDKIRGFYRFKGNQCK